MADRNHKLNDIHCQPISNEGGLYCFGCGKDNRLTIPTTCHSVKNDGQAWCSKEICQILLAGFQKHFHLLQN